MFYNCRGGRVNLNYFEIHHTMEKAIFSRSSSALRWTCVVIHELCIHEARIQSCIQIVSKQVNFEVSDGPNSNIQQ